MLRSEAVNAATILAAILVVACIFIRWLDAPDTTPLFLAGLLWTLLTVAFEFSFGHVAFGRLWHDLV